MSKKMFKVFVFFLTLCSSVMWAQDKTVSGTVSDPEGQPLLGVTVLVKGTKSGTATDMDGKFTLKAKEGDVLEFSSVGFDTQTRKVTGAGKTISMKIVMKEEVQQIEGVVVTALGIKRQEKALSYNVQQVKSDELTKVKDANFVNSLNGKVAGVNIQRSAAGVGGATKVVMRGAKSISGNNNVLYVIDGVPINNSSFASDGGNYGTPKSGESISDFNSEDIESINVLTGPSAAALYGAAAANGVILINTKKGKEGKMSINLNSRVELMRPFITPEFQNTYGSDGETSWGGKLATLSTFNPIDFFGVGVVHNNSVDMSVGSAQNQTFVSFASTDSKGVIPTNGYYRHNFTGRNTANFLDNKLHLDLSASYILQGDQNMYTQSGYFNPLTSLYLFPRGDNFNELKAWERWNPARKIYEQYYPYVDNPANGLVKENPYWTINRELFSSKKKRYMFYTSLKYDILDWMNVTGRVRIDNTDVKSEQKLYASTSGVYAESNGRWALSTTNIFQTYADIMLNMNKSFGKYTNKEGVEDNLFNLAVNIGSSYDDFLSEGINVGGRLNLLPNLFSAANLDQRSKPGQSHSHTRNIALFGSGELGWKNRLFLSLTGRTDWASQLVNTGNEAIFYPSAGLSGVISEFVKMPEWFPYLKVRGSFTEVGSPISKQGFTPNTRTLGLSGSGIVPDKDYPFPNFNAERTRSYEVGINAKLFKNALSIDATLYHSNTYNQLMSYKLAPSSGYNNLWLQAGDVQNRGIEAAVSFNHSFGKLEWDSSITFTRNINVIKQLARNYYNPVDGSYFDIKEIEGTSMREGGSMTDVIATEILKRDGQGRLIDNGKGGYEIDNTRRYLLGDLSPKFTLGWRNSFNFNKQLSFDVMVYGRFGGIVQSSTQAWLDRYGVSKVSAEARDRGGVTIDGVVYNARKYYETIGGNGGLGMYYTYDATNIRIQEASLTYKVPMEKLGRLKWCKSLSFSVTGYNLAMLYLTAPFDPESTANTTGFSNSSDFFRMPSLRSFGFSVKASI